MEAEADRPRYDFETRIAILESRLGMGPTDLVCLDEAFRSCPIPDEILALGFDPEMIRDYSAGELSDRMALEDNGGVLGAVLDARETGIGTTSLTRRTADDPGGLTMIDFTEEHGVLLAVSTKVDPAVQSAEGDHAPVVRPRRVTLHRDRYARIVWVGPDTEAMLGFSAEDLLGRSAPEFMHPDDRDRALKGWIAMLTGKGNARHRVRWQARGGEWLWVELTHVNRLDDLDYVETELLDVDDEMAALAQARAGELRFNTLTESLPSGVVRINTDHEVVYVNRWLRDFTGWGENTDPDVLLASIHPDDQPIILDAITRTRDGEPSDLRIRLTTERWTIRQCRVRVRPLSVEGEHDGAIVSIEDVTEAASLQDELRRRAETDALTGLANRVALTRRLDTLLSDGSGLSLLFFDLDGFKGVNDALGHEAGDNLLVEVARRAKRLLRPTDLIARVGGDEFVVVCPWATTTTDAARIADRVISEVQAACTWSTESSLVDCSVGIAIHDGTTPVTTDELISNADMAMYKAKHSGGGQWKTYDIELREAMTHSFELKRAIADMLEADEFQLHVQPLNDLGTGATIAIECLLRWFHSDGRTGDTGKLIQAAEDSGQIVALGRWVLDRACAIAAQAAAAGYADLRVSMNVSGQQLGRGEFEQDLADAIARHGIRPQQLILEVTETVFVGTDGNIVDTLRSIASTGCTIALDDFGTGYSSLNQLRLMPVTMLKIDRSYIADLGADFGTTAITRALVELCHDLDIELVAEGIETAAQAELAAGMGVQVGQGYHLARPMPAESFFEAIAPKSGGEATSP
jgi:diguanylate cyclase (GGDEF)-like protein/PAS domain S-box-containing protein